MEFYEDPHVAIEAGDTLVMIRSSRGEGKPAA
jgi:voltage-gated potassium channel